MTQEAYRLQQELDRRIKRDRKRNNRDKFNEQHKAEGTHGGTGLIISVMNATENSEERKQVPQTQEQSLAKPLTDTEPLAYNMNAKANTGDVVNQRDE